MEILIQIIIFVTESVAMWLSQQPKVEWQKYAPIIGLIGEPFWIYDSYTNQSWGVLGLSLIYTYIWYVGLKTHWLTK